ncbi:MAG TPA: YihY/virulence factor BrkB family protein [Geobacter anodireducens]|nr:YihY/virulence factor BrkB family protein [Geobacter anodireducens]
MEQGPKSTITRYLDAFRAMDTDGLGPVRGRLVAALQAAVAAVGNFVDDQCLLHASALTYSTLLSIVPFFALAFAVLKGLGVQNTLEPFILDQVAAGSHEIVDRIITYINNTKVGSLGAVGLVTLVVSAVTLLGNIEETFNSIWGVRETRSLYRRFSDYLSVVVFGPILIFAAISVTTTLESQKAVLWLIGTAYLGDVLVAVFRLVPYLSIWLALVFLYMLIPNAKVRFRSALVGGVIAGTLWQAAQWGYIHFQVGVAKYNAIYGTLAVLPVFMIWLYASWAIVLFGVEVVYAHQHRRTFRRETHIPDLEPAARERLALALLLEVCRAFFHDRAPWNAERLAERLDVPERTVRETLGMLVARGWLAESCGGETLYLPARELEHMRVRELVASLRGRAMPLADGRFDPAVEWLATRMEGAVAAELGDVNFRTLAKGAGTD